MPVYGLWGLHVVDDIYNGYASDFCVCCQKRQKPYRFRLYNCNWCCHYIYCSQRCRQQHISYHKAFHCMYSENYDDRWLEHTELTGG